MCNVVIPRCCGFIFCAIKFWICSNFKERTYKFFCVFGSQCLCASSANYLFRYLIVSIVYQLFSLLPFFQNGSPNQFWTLKNNPVGRHQTTWSVLIVHLFLQIVCLKLYQKLFTFTIIKFKRNCSSSQTVGKSRLFRTALFWMYEFILKVSN